MKKLLTGNEAVCKAALDCGVKFASAYPGTPSTEILENLSLFKDKLYAEWAPNEKVALESAIGACYAGARSMAAMKHVGLNVAADAFFTNACTGVNGGLVIVDADEPGMHSSQNEQDNRRYAYHANVPMFEPSNSQECYDMIREAYDVSEQYDMPVLFRMTTRICHSKSVVSFRDPVCPDFKEFQKNPAKYVTTPANARRLKVIAIEKIKKLAKYSEETPLNFAEYYDKKVGIIASGICYEYAKEVFGENASYFKVGFSHPLPTKKIIDFASEVEKIYIIEENDPIMETEVKALGIKAVGKELLPLNGEMTPDVIRRCLLNETLPLVDYQREIIPPRPPALCVGCPHRGFFHILGKQKNMYFSGDIGCYTLGVAPPYNAIDSVTCMGASISSAHGAQKVFDMNKNSKMRAVGIIGDSTFFHTGMNSLLNVAYNQSKAITVILDNRITGMTGHQQNPGTGFTAQEDVANEVNIENLVRAIGIKHVKTINPNRLDEVKSAIKWAVDLDEASVIITRYPCALKKFTKADLEEFKDVNANRYIVDTDKCTGCKLCLKSGCMAVSYDKKTKLAEIDQNACLGCSVCSQICHSDAIVLNRGCN